MTLRLALRSGLAVALLVASACGPWGPQGILAGGPYLGAAGDEPVADWSFTDSHLLIGIETRGAWLRHSVTILCVSANGKLYVMARHAPTKRWVRNIGRDPHGAPFVDPIADSESHARIADPSEANAVAHAFLRKYVGIEAPKARALFGPVAPGDDRAELWTWRIAAPEPSS